LHSNEQKPYVILCFSCPEHIWKSTFAANQQCDADVNDSELGERKLIYVSGIGLD